ncbi:MAG: hypothetical protein WCS99_12175 [Limisphaerales bacterium]
MSTRGCQISGRERVRFDPAARAHDLPEFRTPLVNAIEWVKRP